MTSKAVRAACVLTGILTAVLLAALAFAALLAAREGSGLYLAQPGTAAGSIDPAKLRELEEERGLLITYETYATRTAQVLNSTQTVTLIGAGCSHPGVLGYRPLSGGFFTQSAQNAGERHAVLGVAAAHALFGSVRISGNTLSIGGETYIVVGVVEDHDAENLNVYVPISLTPDAAPALMLKDSGSATRIESELSALGIHSGNYDLLDLGALAGAAAGKLKAAALVFAMGFLILAAAVLSRRIRIRLSALGKMLETRYFRELVRTSPGLPLRLAGTVICLAAAVSLLLWLPSRVLELWLDWPSVAPLLEIRPEQFAAKLELLQRILLAADVLFYAVLISVAGLTGIVGKRLTRLI